MSTPPADSPQSESARPTQRGREPKAVKTERAASLDGVSSDGSPSTAAERRPRTLPPTPSGARLSPDKRREQLVDIAIVLFGDPSNEDVSLDDIAKAAGISRNLVYHYFPGKAALISAAARAEGARLEKATEAAAQLNGMERVAASLNAYFDFAEENPHGYRLIYRYAAQNAETRHLLEGNLDLYTNRVMGWLDNPSPATKLAVRSWFAFLVFACLRWLDSPGVSRQELMHFTGQMFVTALTSTGQPLP